MARAFISCLYNVSLFADSVAAASTDNFRGSVEEGLPLQHRTTHLQGAGSEPPRSGTGNVLAPATCLALTW